MWLQFASSFKSSWTDTSTPLHTPQSVLSICIDPLEKQGEGMRLFLCAGHGAAKQAVPSSSGGSSLRFAHLTSSINVKMEIIES